MEPSMLEPRDVAAQAEGLRRQGMSVLRALGERSLAREFSRRAVAMENPEALAALLLEYLLRRKSR